MTSTGQSAAMKGTHTWRLELQVIGLTVCVCFSRALTYYVALNTPEEG